MPIKAQNGEADDSQWPFKPYSRENDSSFWNSFLYLKNSYIFALDTGLTAHKCSRPFIHASAHAEPIVGWRSHNKEARVGKEARHN